MAFPEPYTFPPDEEFVYLEDWEEHTPETGQQSGGGGAASATGQTDVLVGWVTGKKLRSALRWFLGYSYADEGEPYGLHREPPARHPLHPQLYAHTCSYVGFGYPTDRPSSFMFDPSEFEEWDGSPLYRVPWEKYLLTINFRSFGRVAFLPDDNYVDPILDYSDEYKRYCEFGLDPSVQALTADVASQLKFHEGGPSTTTPVTAFPAPLAELMAKAAFTIKWMQVPHEYLSDSQYYLKPTKILDRLGRVNDDTFVGHAKGTLLLTAVKFEPHLFTVTPADPYYPLTGWDVTFVFEQFDPEKGVSGSEYRGHRVFPWREDGKWYYAVRTNAAGVPDSPPKELLPLVAMDKIFQHVSDPS